MGQFGVGQPVPREEDWHLLRGAGRYVDDVRPTGVAYGYVLRSPHAHARILSIDAAAARAAPGVLMVAVGGDSEVLKLGTQVPRVQRRRRDGSPMFSPPQHMLARERVRHVGDSVAFLVAETQAQAKDAAERIVVAYEPLPAVAATDAAVRPGAPAVWEECPDNQAFFHEMGDRAAVEAAFARAAHVVRHRMLINRITANTMEPRGCVAEYDERDSRWIVRCTVQSPHRVRAILANQIFKVPELRFRIIAENVGGGFGMKGGCYPEYALAAFAARQLRRPVKWIAERGEGLLSDEQARDNVTDAELALDRDGRFLALRVRTIVNIGAYYNSDRSSGPAVANLGVLAGTYTTPAIHVEVTGALTHTMPTAQYRGAGRPEAAYVMETMVDLAARELGVDPADLRRRNTVALHAMPFRTGLAYTYDSGDFPKNLEDCLANSDYSGFGARLAQSRKRGKIRGIGISSTVEASNATMMEAAEIRFDPSGNAVLMIGTHDHGQGHATSFKQVLCDKLGIDSDRIRFRCGDTDEVVSGSGTFGSRSAACGSAAILMAADKLIAKGTTIAAHALEVAQKDVSFANGRFTVAGTDLSLRLEDVAKRAFVPAQLPRDLEPGFYETGTYDGGLPTFPNGCHVVEVEVDPDTGTVELVRYSVVDDVGRVLNPLLLKGQVHGGIAQGAGQALMENIAIDEASGQVLTGSFLDYAMPRASDFCSFDVHGNQVPTKLNPLGIKGAGEAGTVGSLPAVMNAINDALSRVGAPYLHMPATPEKVWRALRQASAR